MNAFFKKYGLVQITTRGGNAYHLETYVNQRNSPRLVIKEHDGKNVLSIHMFGRLTPDETKQITNCTV